jgi:hypothetical protein
MGLSEKGLTYHLGQVEQRFAGEKQATFQFKADPGQGVDFVLIRGNKGLTYITAS